jgi:hypothetical protein
MRGVARSLSDLDRVLSLLELGLSDYEIARQTGIPRSTILNWRSGQLPKSPGDDGCLRCCGAGHDFATLPAPIYAYLLAQYLGAGTVFQTGAIGRGLRISSDAQYPGIIEECSAARLRLPALPVLQPLRRHQNAVYIRVRACRRGLATLGPLPHLGRSA